MKFFKKKRPPVLTHSVQLVVNSSDDGGRTGRIIARFAPVLVTSIEEAQVVSERLYRDNKWGNEQNWPTVEINRLPHGIDHV